MTALTPEQIRNGHRRHAALAEHHRAGTGATDRVAHLVHHYLSLLGDRERTIEAFAELFDQEFVLDFASGQITTLVGFEEWVASYDAATSASALTIERMNIVENGDSKCTATIDFEWDGLLADGTHMEMATKHVWIVVDDPSAAFGRIRSIGVVKTRAIAPRSAS